jgi:hypothetical protein
MECEILINLHGCASDISIQLLVDGIKHDLFYFDDCPHTLKFNLSNDPSTHRIQLLMSGKNHSHTKVDNNSAILSDIYAIIESIKIDQIEVKELFCNGLPCYVHNNNNHTADILDQFYGFIGCNGTISMDFYTPINQWFIEHAYDALEHQ